MKTWGDEFRTAFSRIGNLRSLSPQKVNVMALTATATTETYHVVTNRLAMTNTVLVALPPYRDNITYEVRPKIDIDQLTTSLCAELNAKWIEFPKTVIYVRKYSDCSNIYMLLNVLTLDKREVLQSFSKPGILRIVIATTAFRMGIDCPEIRQIIHWGIPTTMEEYVQETGRSGRDGNSSMAVLYRGKGGRHGLCYYQGYFKVPMM